MPHQTHKVQKSIKKKKGSASLHVDSRDAKRLRKAIIRDDKVNKGVAARAKQNGHLLVRVQYFKDQIEKLESEPGTDLLLEVARSYIHRNDDDLEKIKASRRPGRPPDKKEAQLVQQQEIDLSEFRSGYWVPDISSPENRTKLARWQGEWSALALVDFVRIFPSGDTTKSAFPPRGA